MEKQNDSIRDRLLARMPQPENLAAFREETASLLAKHKKALFWGKWSTQVIGLLAVGVFLMTQFTWGPKLDTTRTVVFDVVAGIFFFMSQIWRLEYDLNRNQVSLLKEVKQVQLQVLELQASLDRKVEPQSVSAQKIL
jgi:hypothetical protein